jgi:hypothetical protein
LILTQRRNCPLKEFFCLFAVFVLPLEFAISIRHKGEKCVRRKNGGDSMSHLGSFMVC